MRSRASRRADFPDRRRCTRWCSGARSSISFPTRQLEVSGDRSIIDWDGSADETYYRLHDDPDGLGVEIEWLGTRLAFQPGNPSPLLSTERRMVEVIVEAIDLRFRGLFNQELSHRFDRFQYQTEDLIVADYLDTVSPYRIPAALEALRVAALSTYENRRVSTGALLLGTEHDPAAPAYKNVAGAPSFNARLTAIKGFHRLCDGVRTVFLVDRQGDLARLIDVARWAEAAQGSEPLLHPCPRTYVEPRQGHAVGRARLPGADALAGDQGLRRRDADVQLQRRPLAAARHPQQVRGLVRGGRPVRMARPGLVDLPGRAQPERSRGSGRFSSSCATRSTRSPSSSRRPTRSRAEVVADDPQDPENLSPKHAKRALHHVVRGMKLADLEPSVLEAIACLDGAVVTDLDGRLLTFGAILRIAPETLELGRAVQGARTLAGLAASLHGPVLKVSEDGYLTMFFKGRRVWEL